MKEKCFGLMILILSILAISCATTNNMLAAFIPDSHGSDAEEWQPHEGVKEWWYVTGIVNDTLGSRYLYQFTIFHGYRFFTEGYTLNLSLFNANTGEHIFEEKSGFVSNENFGNDRTISFGTSSLTASASGIHVKGNGEKFSFDFQCTIEKPAAWHGEDGIIVMGNEKSPQERSFYYSYTKMSTTGRIETADSKGNRIARNCRGESWFDRQWGKFSELGWDWFSIRLFNGTEIMLFSFPKWDYREATFVDRSGSTKRIRDFAYTVDRMKAFDGSMFGLGWNLNFNEPGLAAKMKIEPVSDDQYNPSSIIKYWEGLCYVYGPDNELIGYCVAETTEAAYR